MYETGKGVTGGGKYGGAARAMGHQMGSNPQNKVPSDEADRHKRMRGDLNSGSPDMGDMYRRISTTPETPTSPD